MSSPKQFNVLIVRGNGRQVIRLNVPRSVMQVGGFAAIALFSLQAYVVTDYVLVKRYFTSAGAAYTAAMNEREASRALRQRLATVTAEVASWAELHATIWSSITPQAAKDRASSKWRGAAGIGGGPLPIGHHAAPTDIGGQLDQLASTVSEEGRRLRTLSQLLTRAGKAIASLPSQWPVKGVVNSEFGRRHSPWSRSTEFHEGVDIVADRGTEVKAPAPGKVVFAGRAPGYGHTLVLDHGSEVKTRFAHLQSIRVRSGQEVQRGDLIALTGNSGRSTGPHLHYEVIVRGQPTNPRFYVWE